jgi:hypothetical protein
MIKYVRYNVQESTYNNRSPRTCSCVSKIRSDAYPAPGPIDYEVHTSYKKEANLSSEHWRRKTKNMISPMLVKRTSYSWREDIAPSRYNGTWQSIYKYWGSSSYV